MIFIIKRFQPALIVRQRNLSLIECYFAVEWEWKIQTREFRFIGGGWRMAKHIFISYSRKDTEFVDKLAADMKKAGFKIWIDRTSILGGDKWRRQIVKAIGKAQAVLIVLSSSSVQSDNVRKEIDIAEQKGIKKILIDIEYHELPDDFLYQLAGEQKINFKTDYEAGLADFLQAFAPLKQKYPSLLFIYHPQERIIAQRLAEHLTSTLDVNAILAPVGYEVGSKGWMEQFERDSQKASASIILMSNLAVKDEWVRKRISHTIQKNIPPIPIELEQLDANNIPKELEYYQWALYHQRDERELKFIVDIVENMMDQK